MNCYNLVTSESFVEQACEISNKDYLYINQKVYSVFFYYYISEDSSNLYLVSSELLS